MKSNGCREDAVEDNGMNITFVKLKGVIEELRGIRQELARIGDCMEYDLADKGIRLRAKSDPAPTEQDSFEYVDEEIDWARENIPNFDALMKQQPKE